MPSLSQPPTSDRLSLLHAIMNALHDTVAVFFKYKYMDASAAQAISVFPLEVVLSSHDLAQHTVPIGTSSLC